MSAVVVRLPPLASPVREVWHTLMDLAQTGLPDWTVVGGQMVLLHALAHGTMPPQVSQDGDVIGDVRADPATLRHIVQFLESHGFVVDGMSPDGLAHRYRLPGRPRDVLVDVLAPDGLGERTDLTTTRPGRTLEVPGGTQALRRTERVMVEHEDRRVLVPRPSLLGAIVGKGAACGLPGNVSRHLRDMALLCSLAPDPFAMAEELDKTDRAKLRRAAALDDQDHHAWALVPAELRRDGQATYALLTTPPTPPS